MKTLRFVLIVLAGVALYFSVHTLKQHGVEPSSRDFWISQGCPFVAGLVVMMAGVRGKKEKK